MRKQTFIPESTNICHFNRWEKLVANIKDFYHLWIKQHQVFPQLDSMRHVFFVPGIGEIHSTILVKITKSNYVGSKIGVVKSSTANPLMGGTLSDCCKTFLCMLLKKLAWTSTRTWLSSASFPLRSFFGIFEIILCSQLSCMDGITLSLTHPTNFSYAIRNLRSSLIIYVPNDGKDSVHMMEAQDLKTLIPFSFWLVSCAKILAL